MMMEEKGVSSGSSNEDNEWDVRTGEDTEGMAGKRDRTTREEQWEKRDGSDKVDKQVMSDGEVLL